ncbi:MAG: SDR family NAD(P)-dependent oxidoreductase [Bacteroidetes bacterium]|nr:SDR family NAD(P)-dependent oxidoreductase [Bacteroidota bacterium]
MRQLFITGTSRGIGRAIAEAACASGLFRVTGYARGSGPEHPAYTHVTLDLSDAAALETFAFPPLEDNIEQVVLINNAGMLGPVAHLGSFDAAAIDATVRVNLTAPLVLSNAFIHAYSHFPAPRLIVHVSTGAATSPYDGWSLYCSTKAGLDMLARVQERELAMRKDGWPFAVRAIAPGVVQTAMQATLRASDASGFSLKQKFIELDAQGQLSDARQVGEAYLQVVLAIGDDPAAYPDLITRIPPLA